MICQHNPIHNPSRFPLSYTTLSENHCSHQSMDTQARMLNIMSIQLFCCLFSTIFPQKLCIHSIPDIDQHPGPVLGGKSGVGAMASFYRISQYSKTLRRVLQRDISHYAHTRVLQLRWSLRRLRPPIHKSAETDQCGLPKSKSIYRSI